MNLKHNKIGYIRIVAAVIVVTLTMFGCRNDVNSAVPGPNQFVKFYVKYGTFGDIDNGKHIIIPYGTSIYGKMPDGTTVRVFISESTVLSKYDTIKYVTVKLAQGDTEIPAACLTEHELTWQNEGKLNGRLCVTNDAYDFSQELK